jgi:hypothetical protein
MGTGRKVAISYTVSEDVASGRGAYRPMRPGNGPSGGSGLVLMTGRV